MRELKSADFFAIKWGAVQYEDLRHDSPIYIAIVYTVHKTEQYLHLQEGRTPLHYAAALQGTTGGLNQLYSVLADSKGADENVVDVVSTSFFKQVLSGA